MVNQSQSTLNLSPDEIRAIEKFLHKAREVYGKEILQTALFGSKARGNATATSDIDLLLIVTNDNWIFQRALIELSAEIGLEQDVLFDLRIISLERWQQMSAMRSGLVRSIEKESIPLAG